MFCGKHLRIHELRRRGQPELCLSFVDANALLIGLHLAHVQSDNHIRRVFLLLRRCMGSRNHRSFTLRRLHSPRGAQRGSPVLRLLLSPCRAHTQTRVSLVKNLCVWPFIYNEKLLFCARIDSFVLFCASVPESMNLNRERCNRESSVISQSVISQEGCGLALLVSSGHDVDWSLLATIPVSEMHLTAIPYWCTCIISLGGQRDVPSQNRHPVLTFKTKKVHLQDEKNCSR